MSDLDFSCSCGSVRWILRRVSPRNGIRCICHCDDCQAFAHFLGRADEILDANGGTEAVQLPASRLVFREGEARLACVHVTSGPLLRWYCAECRSPVAATFDTSTLSFLSVPLFGCDRAEADVVLGSCTGHVWTKFGKGDLSAVKRVNMPAMALRIAARMIGARLSGDYRNTAFFDRRTGAPIARPRRLSRVERAVIDAEMERRGG